MGSLQWGGARIHFAERGEGAVVLLLHAFPLSSAMWTKQMTALKDGFRAVALDFPGFGKSERLPTPATIDLFAQAALAVLDAVDAKKAVVVGISMGGYAALELRARAPQRVAALALCDTRATADTPDGRKAREVTARAVEEDGCQILAERMIPNLVTSAAPEALKREIEKLITENSPEGAAAALRAMAGRRDFTSALKEIDCPALVMVGAQDSVTPPAEAQALVQGIPGAVLETIPGAGHLSNLENPKAFDAGLRAFLEENRARLT